VQAQSSSQESMSTILSLVSSDKALKTKAESLQESIEKTYLPSLHRDLSM